MPPAIGIAPSEGWTRPNLAHCDALSMKARCGRARGPSRAEQREIRPGQNPYRPSPTDSQLFGCRRPGLADDRGAQPVGPGRRASRAWRTGAHSRFPPSRSPEPPCRLVTALRRCLAQVGPQHYMLPNFASILPEYSNLSHDEVVQVQCAQPRACSVLRSCAPPSPPGLPHREPQVPAQPARAAVLRRHLCCEDSSGELLHRTEACGPRP